MHVNEALKKFISEDCIYFKKNGIINVIRKPSNGSFVLKCNKGKTVGYELHEKHYDN